MAVGTEAGVGVGVAVGLEQANNTTKTRNTDRHPNFGIARLSPSSLFQIYASPLNSQS